MDMTRKLIEDIEEYGREYPDQESFVKALRQTVERIQSEFEGDVREGLLAEARSTLEQQKDIHEANVRTLAALERLKKSQEQLLKSLLGAAVARPPGVTLH
jgi:hypothetical protein